MSGWTTLAVTFEPTLTVMPEAERAMTSGWPEAEVTVVLPLAIVGLYATVPFRTWLSSTLRSRVWARQTLLLCIDCATHSVLGELRERRADLAEGSVGRGEDGDTADAREHLNSLRRGTRERRDEPATLSVAREDCRRTWRSWRCSKGRSRDCRGR